MWEFSFAGEPIFVVCSTPAQVMRKAVGSSAFMLTFSRRWVFERSLERRKPHRPRSPKYANGLSLRQHSPSPLLGRYGTMRTRVSAILPPDDNNAELDARLPNSRRPRSLKSKTGSKRHDPDHRWHEDKNSRSTRIMHCFPTQGSIRIAARCAGKVHHFHTHPVDEILVIISGRLELMWEGGERICGAGDTSCLPAGTLHQSEALDDAIYAIATRPPAAGPVQQTETGGACQDNAGSLPPGPGAGSVERRSTSSMISKR